MACRMSSPSCSCETFSFHLPHSIQAPVGLQMWWSSETITMVTGANRGIGFEIARQLSLHGVTVILTSRETEVGEEAAKVLQEGGLNVVFRQLDGVTNFWWFRYSGKMV